MTRRRNAPRFFCVTSCNNLLLYLSHIILYTWQVVGEGGEYIIATYGVLQHCCNTVAKIQQGGPTPTPSPPSQTPGSGRGGKTHRGTTGRVELLGNFPAHPPLQINRGPNFTLYCLIQTLMVIVL